MPCDFPGSRIRIHILPAVIQHTWVALHREKFVRNHFCQALSRYRPWLDRPHWIVVYDEVETMLVDITFAKNTTVSPFIFPAAIISMFRVAVIRKSQMPDFRSCSSRPHFFAARKKPCLRSMPIWSLP